MFCEAVAYDLIDDMSVCFKTRLDSVAIQDFMYEDNQDSAR